MNDKRLIIVAVIPSLNVICLPIKELYISQIIQDPKTQIVHNYLQELLYISQIIQDPKTSVLLSNSFDYLPHLGSVTSFALIISH